jgi:HlyD family secretion protein
LAWSGGITILALSGGLFYALVLRQPATPPEVSVIPVTRDTVEITLNESGIVELGNQQVIRSPVEGAVDEVLVQPGDRIESGQVLITLRNPERQTALLEQDIAITQQDIALQRQRQAIAEAAEQLAADEEQLQRLASLANDGIVPLVDVQEQENQVRRSLATLRQAETDAQDAALALESLRVAQQRIEQEVANTVITAPMNGVVLGVDVVNGDGIERRTELITVGNPAQEQVDLNLSTLNAARVRPNQLARITVIGPTTDVFTGRVASLYPLAIAPEEDDSDSSQSVVPTIVRLDTPSRTLIPGSRVNVEIVIEQQASVIALDVSAIQQMSDRPFVWILDDDNRVQQQSITLGLEGLVTVEVTEGLSEGDRVVLPSPDLTLEPNLEVTPLP